MPPVFVDDYPFGGKPPKALEHLLWTDQPTTNDRPQRNQITAAIGHGDIGAPLTNLLEVCKNLPIFGGRPISGAVEALLTKVVNRQSSVSPIVVFVVAPHHATGSMLA